MLVSLCVTSITAGLRTGEESRGGCRVVQQTTELGLGKEHRSLLGMGQETGQIYYRKGCLS